MTKVHQLFIIIFFGYFPALHGQHINEILTKYQWSAYDNFAVIDFMENGKAEIEYAYCTYCQGNKETLDWTLADKLLIIGKDSLTIQSASKNEIKTFQQHQLFTLKNVAKLKATKLRKAAIKDFLVSKKQLKMRTKEATLPKAVDFTENGKMWLDKPEYRGQWALKSFYGDLFLIYIHRNTVNRDFPLLKIQSLKKGKLVGQSIPSMLTGEGAVLEIEQ